MLECAVCIDLNRKDIDDGAKYVFPADLVYKGVSLCREHYFEVKEEEVNELSEP
jgi:hypothetical protein